MFLGLAIFKRHVFTNKQPDIEPDGQPPPPPSPFQALMAANPTVAHPKHENQNGLKKRTLTTHAAVDASRRLFPVRVLAKKGEHLGQPQAAPIAAAAASADPTRLCPLPPRPIGHRSRGLVD